MLTLNTFFLLMEFNFMSEITHTDYQSTNEVETAFTIGEITKEQRDAWLVHFVELGKATADLNAPHLDGAHTPANVQDVIEKSAMNKRGKRVKAQASSTLPAVSAKPPVFKEENHGKVYTLQDRYDADKQVYSFYKVPFDKSSGVLSGEAIVQLFVDHVTALCADDGVDYDVVAMFAKHKTAHKAVSLYKGYKYIQMCEYIHQAACEELQADEMQLLDAALGLESVPSEPQPKDGVGGKNATDVVAPESKMDILLADSRMKSANLTSDQVQFLQNLVRENPIYSPADCWNPAILLTVLQAHNDRVALSDAKRKETIHTALKPFEVTTIAIADGSFKTCESGITSGFTRKEATNFSYLSVEIPIISKDCLDLPSKIYNAFLVALKSACWNAAKQNSGGHTSWFIAGKSAYKLLYVLDPRVANRGTRSKVVSDFRLAYPKCCFPKHVASVESHFEIKHVFKFSVDIDDLSLVLEFLTPDDVLAYKKLIGVTERKVTAVEGDLLLPDTKIVI